MKKIILAVILMAVAGGGIYYLLQKQNDRASVDNKQLITGKWKIDSPDVSRTKDSSMVLAFLVSDSNLHKYEFDVDRKGLLIQSLNGIAEDTTRYEFNGTHQLLIWMKGGSAVNKFTISKLDSLHLVIQDKDSTVFSFRKVK